MAKLHLSIVKTWVERVDEEDGERAIDSYGIKASVIQHFVIRY